MALMYVSIGLKETSVLKTSLASKPDGFDGSLRLDELGTSRQ